MSTSPASPFIFESYGGYGEHAYRVLRREDRALMGYVERDYAREWIVRDLNFNFHDYVKGEGVISYRTRNVAAHVLHNAFEAGEIAGAKPSAEVVVPVERELDPDVARAELDAFVRALNSPPEPDNES